jgi:hypothetical protein
MTDCLADLALPEVSGGRERTGLSSTISRPEDERLKAMAERWMEQAPAIHAKRGAKV